MKILLSRVGAAVLGCALIACSSPGPDGAPDRDRQTEPRGTAGPPATGTTGTARPAPEPGKPAEAGPPVSATDEAATLEDFESRIDAYMKLRNREEKGPAELKETNDPSEITSAQDILVARLRSARKDAKHGDIFTPEIRALFRRLMYPELVGADAANTKKAIAEDAPPRKAVALQVNAKYPEGTPLPTMPPNLLVRLPPLPEELEYRIIGKDLILRDADANLIVDFIPGAIR